MHVIRSNRFIRPKRTNAISLSKSYQAYERALQKVQGAMRKESNPVDRRDMVATWGRLVEKMEIMRKQLSAIDKPMAGQRAQ